MLRFCFLVFPFFLSFIVCCCSSTEPDEQLNISLADASCTEAWLQVTGETGKEIRLLRDDKEVQRFTLTTSPMTVYDDSLRINTSYSYRAEHTEDGEKSSIKVTTLDTTSHNFTWQTYEFGDIGSSYFEDVAIIDDRNIWAVGDIMLRDTSENGYTDYNAAHWDGTEWKLYAFNFFTFCGQSHTYSYPATSIIAYNKEEIFIANLSKSITQIADTKQTYLGCIPIGVNSLWGWDKNNMYAVGIEKICRFENSQWVQLDSKTNMIINDVYGDYNKQTGEYEAIAVASNEFQSLDRDILKINGNKVTPLAEEPIPTMLSTVWFRPNSKYFVAGDGIYMKNGLDDEKWKAIHNEITKYYIHKIRGAGLNDIVAAGGFGEVLHFNGKTWQSFIDITKRNGNNNSVAIKGNIIVAAGGNGARAAIIIGRR